MKTLGRRWSDVCLRYREWQVMASHRQALREARRFADMVNCRPSRGVYVFLLVVEWVSLALWGIIIVAAIVRWLVR